MDKFTWHRLILEESRLEADSLGSSSAEEELLVLIGEWLDTSQQCVLAMMKAKEKAIFSLPEIQDTFRRDRNYQT